MSDFEKSGAARTSSGEGSGHPDELTSQPPAVDPEGTAHPAPEPDSRRPLPLSALLPIRALPWAALILAVLALTGAVLAWLWTASGPHVDVVMTEFGPTLDDAETEAFVAGDATFAGLTALVGVVSAVSAWRLRRWRGPFLVIALAIGNLAGAWITWKYGATIGRAEYQELVESADAGSHFDQPMRLRAEGLVFLQAIAAVTVYMVLAAWARDSDLDVPAEEGSAEEGSGPRHAAVSSAPSGPGAGPAELAPPGAGTASSPPA